MMYGSVTESRNAYKIRVENAKMNYINNKITSTNKQNKCGIKLKKLVKKL